MSRLRTAEVSIAAVATLLLAYLVNPWIEPPEGLRGIITVAFWVLAIALVIVLFMERNNPAGQEIEIEGPAFARFLFSNSAAGLVWLPIRVFLAFSWLDAGLHKLGDPGWMQGGASLAGYWQGAVKIPETGRPPITFEWYRDFLNLLINNNAQTWFAPLVTFGEIAVGLGLLFGCLTGIAAFFGALMNMSFLLAGSASSNPVLFTLAIGIMLAWKVAGYYGIDRWLLPILGTPWRRRPVATQAAQGAAAG